MEIRGLERAPNLPKRRSTECDSVWQPTLKIRERHLKAVQANINDLKKGDHVQHPRDQGLRDIPGVTPPARLRHTEFRNLGYLTKCDEYLGPFDREMPFVNTTYQFALKKWQRLHRHTHMFDNEAAGQLWGIQALWCRETSWVTGQEIAKLLLSDPWTFESRKPLPPGNGSRTLINAIISGKEEEAADLAKAEGLLDHWVILRDMAKGLRDSLVLRLIDRLKDDDPMKTYFQLLVGRFPTAATQCGDENWGDWRPHLAIVLCKVHKCNLRKEIMAKMTRALALGGKANSAFLCELIMNLNCGIFLEKSAPLDKIRSNPSLQCSRVTFERLQIYEFIMKIKPDQPFISDSQIYRIHVSRMLFKAGYMELAERFCHDVGMSFSKSTYKDVDYTTLTEFMKLCSDQPVENVKWIDWFKESAERMMKNKPKPITPLESTIDPEVDAIMPSPDTVAMHVVRSQERHLKKQRYLTPEPSENSAIDTNEEVRAWRGNSGEKPKKKKSTGCFGWLRCFCFCRRKKR